MFWATYCLKRFYILPECQGKLGLKKPTRSSVLPLHFTLEKTKTQREVSTAPVPHRANGRAGTRFLISGQGFSGLFSGSLKRWASDTLLAVHHCISKALRHQQARVLGLRYTGAKLLESTFAIYIKGLKNGHKNWLSNWSHFLEVVLRQLSAMWAKLIISALPILAKTNQKGTKKEQA